MMILWLYYDDIALLINHDDIGIYCTCKV